RRVAVEQEGAGREERGASRETRREEESGAAGRPSRLPPRTSAGQACVVRRQERERRRNAQIEEGSRRAESPGRRPREPDRARGRENQGARGRDGGSRLLRKPRNVEAGDRPPPGPDVGSRGPDEPMGGVAFQ